MAKKALFVVGHHDFRDEELLEPRALLDRRGITTKIAAKTRHKAIGKRGTVIEPDLALPEVNVNDFDAIIFIGGPGAREYFADDDAFKLARAFKARGKVIGGICLAISVLANAGVLISKTVTGFPTEEENVKNKGADYTGMSVEVDDQLVTAKDPTAAKEFGEKLIYLLEEE